MALFPITLHISKACCTIIGKPLSTKSCIPLFILSFSAPNIGNNFCNASLNKADDALEILQKYFLLHYILE